jgi:hypothetical protein
MQKVEGSSPFIRLGFKPFWGYRAFDCAPVMPQTLRRRGIATYALTDSLRSEDVGAEHLADHSG